MDEGILLDHPTVYVGFRGKRVTVLKRRLDPGTQTYDLLVRLLAPEHDATNTVGDDTWWVTEEAVERKIT